MKKRGFTLVEFVIVMSVGVVIALVAAILYAPVRNWTFVRDRRGGAAEATAAVMKIVREVGRIKDPTQIAAATATHLQFVDIDDAVIDFQQSGTDLLRGTDALARNLQGLTFTYLDRYGAVATIPGQIKIVIIKLSIQSGMQTVQLESAARIRNYL
jgi:prepilin-type N-terminal cleavage/methylation domain-containing protein